MAKMVQKNLFFRGFNRIGVPPTSQESGERVKQHANAAEISTHVLPTHISQLSSFEGFRPCFNPSCIRLETNGHYDDIDRYRPSSDTIIFSLCPWYLTVHGFTSAASSPNGFHALPLLGALNCDEVLSRIRIPNARGAYLVMRVDHEMVGTSPDAGCSQHAGRVYVGHRPIFFQLKLTGSSGQAQ